MKRLQGRGGRASESGLRPASAFVLIAGVLLAVTAKAAYIAFVVEGEQPRTERTITAPWPRFEVQDRTGRPLAVSVECFDLTLSPRATWLSHTPDHMARRIAQVLGDDSAAHLLERFLPATPAPGEVGLLRPVEPRLLRFEGDSLERVDEWLQTGSLIAGEGAGRIEGFWLAPLAGSAWTLEWAPAMALCREARQKHLGAEAAERPASWTRRLLGDLALLVGDERLGQELQDLPRRDGPARRRAVRDALWAELMPSTFRVVRRRLRPVTAHALSELLRSEAVSPWQMKLTECLDRRHPSRPDETRPVLFWPPGAEAPGPAQRADAFRILGHWGVLGPADALARARADRDLVPHLLDWSGAVDPVARRAWELETEWRPWSGLELLCGNELADPRWQARLEVGARSYERLTRHLARDRRKRWEDHRVPDYFQNAQDGADIPRFESTLDATLQQFVHDELLTVLHEFRAALAQAIVLEVETGDVLAVDGVYAYEVSGFAPIRHQFTPGSTMKAITMAIALDRGVVERHELFATFAPEGIDIREGRAKRHIGEALGAPKEAYVSAEQGLARSVNAVLVQIGLRVPAPVLRAKLIELGYGVRPDVGLGPEACGLLPPLDRHGSWSKPYTHASVAFGHELSVSLWQHAAALATVMRGGLSRPLRLLRAVEQGDRRWELEVEPGRRVLSESACRIVRGMLATGAREGTGDDVASPEQCPEFSYVGTKTGTTEKVPTEVSLHVEWPRQIELAAEGLPWTTAEHRALIGERQNLGFHERICYTSSMCVVGRLPGNEREVLVLLVVDEPRSRKKFGADVAGAAAVAIMRHAHGLPRVAGAQPKPPRPPGATAFNDSEVPWAEEASW